MADRTEYSLEIKSFCETLQVQRKNSTNAKETATARVGWLSAGAVSFSPHRFPSEEEVVER